MQRSGGSEVSCDLNVNFRRPLIPTVLRPRLFHLLHTYSGSHRKTTVSCTVVGRSCGGIRRSIWSGRHGPGRIGALALPNN